jgi:hypothetical protein
MHEGGLQGGQRLVGVTLGLGSFGLPLLAARSAAVAVAVAGCAGWPGRSGAEIVVAEVNAACSGCAPRGEGFGACSTVSRVAPTRAAARAWAGAIAGSLGAGWPRIAAATSMISETARTAHSSHAASASTRMIAPSVSGAAKNPRACCQPGQARGSGDPVALASPQGRPASSAAIAVSPAAARRSLPVRTRARVTGALR